MLHLYWEATQLLSMLLTCKMTSLVVGSEDMINDVMMQHKERVSPKLQQLTFTRCRQLAEERTYNKQMSTSLVMRKMQHKDSSPELQLLALAR